MGWWTGAGRQGWAVLACALVQGCREQPRALFEISGDAASRTGLVALAAPPGGAPSGALLGNEAGGLLCLGPAGSLRWRRELGHEVALPPVLTQGGEVVVATVDGDWFGLAADTGQERWHTQGRSAPLGLGSDGVRVFSLAADGSLEALDPGNGEPLWKQALGAARPQRQGRDAPRARGALWVPTPAVGLVSWNDGLAAFAPADGTVVWRHPLPGVVGASGGEAGLFVTTQGGQVLLLDPRTGQVLARSPLGEAAVSPPCLAFGQLWVGLATATLVELEPASLRHVTGLSLPAPMTGCPEPFDGLLAVPTRGLEGKLLFFRPGRSAPVAEVRLNSPLWASPLAMGDALWVPSHDGRVTGLLLPRELSPRRAP